MQNQLVQDRGFHVAHQTVSVDVNLQDWSLEGWTELTIVPANAYLREIRLDCRQSRIHGILVNGKKANYYHQDVLKTTTMSVESTVNQHHHYRNGIDDLLQDRLPGELVITLPRNFKIVPQDSTAANQQGLAGSGGSDYAFVPITIKIDFALYNPTSGVNFVGGSNSNVKKPYWHAYTTHSPIGQATSSWLPCVDGMWEQCTWQVQISVPRTVRDIKTVESNQETKNNNNNNNSTSNDGGHGDREEHTNGKGDDVGDAEDDNIEEDMTLSDGEREELDRDIVVVCNNASSSEVSIQT